MKTRRLIAPAAVLTLAAAATLTGMTATAQTSGPAASPAPAAPADQTPPPTPPPVGQGVTNAQNERVPAGASWTQHYFPSADDSGTELHADVLVPEGLAEGQQVTPIVSVGPYFSHSGALTAGEFT
jgi:uncharacterized protein